MGGGRRPPGGFADCFSSSGEDDASISDESQRTNSPPPQPCDACNSAYSRARALLNSRESIRRYKPGDFIDDVAKDDNFEIPEITTLLLVGGSGKSSLVSKIKSLFEDVWDLPTVDVAPLSDDSSMAADSYSLQEHMIIKNSTSVCVYDTPGWSVDPEDNYKIFQRWMKNGVCHGEIDISDSADGIINKNCNPSVPKECEIRLNKKRMVNYVILVADAISVLKSIDTQDSSYLDIIYATFNYPFLTLKGNKPAVVVTNGDKLSSVELSHVLKTVEGLLGIPPSHIFNISGTDNYHAEFNILNLLWHCLEKADQGLPLKQKSRQEKQKVGQIISKLDSCSDLAIDMFIVYLCILFLFGSWMGYAVVLSS